MKTIFISLVTIMILLVLTGPFFAHAAIVPCGIPAGQACDGAADCHKACDVCHLFVGIGNIVTFATQNVAFPVAVIVIIYGGVMWVTAGASEDNVKKGQKAIKQAIIGLIVTFACWIIIDTILRVLITGGLGGGTPGVGVTIKEWGPWNDFPSCN